MRAEAPVYLDETNALWGLARYADVVAAGRDPATFSSAGGSRPNTGPMPWMIDLDPPDHLKRRKLVNRGFTPARVRDTEPHLREICDDLIDRVCERGECDFVHDLAAPLPDDRDRRHARHPAERPRRAAELVRRDARLARRARPRRSRPPRSASPSSTRTRGAWSTIARAEPTDDLVSVLVHAEVDGDRLTDDEIVFETLLLLVGGDETTRHVLTGGTEQLLLAPRRSSELLRRDPTALPCAVEEMLRWVSPIKNMARTVTRDVELGGQPLHAGDKVVLLYESANFDEAQFDDPQRFDVAPHARTTTWRSASARTSASAPASPASSSQTMFGRLLARLPDLGSRPTSRCRRSIGAIQSMPVTFTPSAPLGAAGGGAP